MSKQYTTVEKVSNYLLSNISSTFESQIEYWIIAMSNYISLATNREWLADETANARWFDGNGYQALEVGDFIGNPTLEIGDAFGENMVAETDFITYPHNTTTKNTIVLKNENFENSIKNVRVTAKWGYLATVPKDIEFATTVLVAGIVMAQTNQDGEVESEKIGNYSVKYVTDQQKSDYVNVKEIISNRALIRI
jgi:hypothetical protein